MNNFRGQPANSFDLPEKIERLGKLAYNLWWTWRPDAQRLFAWIDPYLWEETYHNPISFLRSVKRTNLNAVVHDRYFMMYYDQIMAEFDEYMQANSTWFSRNHSKLLNQQIAYFSTEFGLHETLPIYAGGLGVLSGDHAKEASDLGLPFVGVGFFYTQGYFSQHITEDGWQEAREALISFDDLPALPVLDEDDRPMTVSVELPGRNVLARMWEVRVGRVTAVFARYRRERQLRERPASDSAPVQQRPRPAHLAGDHPGHRRGARPADNWAMTQMSGI